MGLFFCGRGNWGIWKGVSEMQVSELLEILNKNFFTGVPDSQLKELCSYLMEKKGIGKDHIIAANEGNCVGLAAGHYLATGEIPVVYMQNSGLGNIVNPAASLLHTKVYGIPCIFIVGWRGEPGVHDEPQHIYQGEITETLIRDLDMDYFIITKETTPGEIKRVVEGFDKLLERGKSVAFIVKKAALESGNKINYHNENTLTREEVIEQVVDAAAEDVIVSTTGKASRELFEIRERKGQGHERDFLTVGSMGHSSSIALGIAMEKPGTKVWCVDGDGAVLMHMGAMALIGANKPDNMVHMVINNAAHETVGGMPTVAGEMNLPRIAEGCGYPVRLQVSSKEELSRALKQAKASTELIFIEVKCSISSRANLGRPTTTAQDNKENFMEYLKQCD